MLLPGSLFPSRSSTVDVSSLQSLTPEHLVKEMERLDNSIVHLSRSNEEISKLVRAAEPDSEIKGSHGAPTAEEREQAEDLDSEDVEELRKACQENDETIVDQKALLGRMRDVLVQKAGPHALPATITLGSAAMGTAGAVRSSDLPSSLVMGSEADMEE